MATNDTRQNKSSNEMSNRIANYWKYFLLILSGIALVAGIGYLLYGFTANGTALAVLGMAISVLAIPERFDSFKALGFEAKLREVKNDLHDQLKAEFLESSRIHANFLFQQLSLLGRRETEPRVQSLEKAKRIFNHLSDIGMSAEELEEVSKPWHRSVFIDLISPADKAIHACLNLLTQHRVELQRSGADNSEAIRLTEQAMAIRGKMLNIFINAEPEVLLKSMQEVLLAIRGANLGEAQNHFNDSFGVAESSLGYAQDYWKTKALKNEAYWKALVTPYNEIWQQFSNSV
ncbi:MAG: hypothetical protein WA071_14930 [Undibacterium umbellatum]|uniref:hypothetical protein n=1 Tax=Undibacterium umbellatum TaxID=2762300 RepID=UPI003BB77CE7